MIKGYSDDFQLFCFENISDSSRSTLIGKEIVQVTELTHEFLTLVMPRILSRTKTPQPLDLLAETFNASSLTYFQVPGLHIELDLFSNLDAEKLSKLYRQKET